MLDSLSPHTRGVLRRPRSSDEPVHLLVDSTGLKVCGPGEWLVESVLLKHTGKEFNMN